MKIVRLRARAILALAICTICALAVMKALSDNTNVVDEIAPPRNGQEPVEVGRRGGPRGGGERRGGGKNNDDQALVGDRAAPGAQPAAFDLGRETDSRKAYDIVQTDKPTNDGDNNKNVVGQRIQIPAITPQQQALPRFEPQVVPFDSNNKMNVDNNRQVGVADGRLRVDAAAVLPPSNVGAAAVLPPSNVGAMNSAGNQQQQRQTYPAAAKSFNSSGYPIIMNGKFVPTRRIVHLDLKGAAPKVHYFEKFFQMISRLGATGILIEWEDTFPYTGELLECRSGRAYTESDVRTIFGWARANDLEVIPLVQTFGHLEWILKHPKFAHLREVDRYAQVICPTNPEAVNVVKMAIDQVMSMHQSLDGGSEYFHMGADEAFQIGMCERCIKAIREQFNNNREKLLVKHVTTIAEYVKKKYNRRVLMWHDMLNNVDSQTMKEAKIGDLVEPVVWAYAENLNDYLMPDMWQRFSQSFPYIWAASAFKGADGPSRFYSNVPHYLQNHVSWGQQMTREYKNFREFRGIILTGWQRFDHFAVLCELLPVGVPSLAVNLQIVLNGGDYNRQIIGTTSRLLECSSYLDVDSPGVAGYCQFPGNRIYQYVQQLKMSQQNLKQNLLEDYQLHGWLSDFNVVHNYSSAWYLDQLVDKIHMSLNDLTSLSRALRTELSKVFEDDTVDEFLMEYLEPDLEHLQKLFEAAKGIGQIRTFPGRPFAIRSLIKSPPSTSRQGHQQQENQAVASQNNGNAPGPPAIRPNGV